MPFTKHVSQPSQLVHKKPPVIMSNVVNHLKSVSKGTLEHSSSTVSAQEVVRNTQKQLRGGSMASLNNLLAQKA